MSQEIPAPNFTQIPNVIFDYWIPRLRPATVKVFIVFFANTYKKKSLSKTKISTLTGLCRNTVVKSLNELKSHNLLEVDNAGSFYALKIEALGGKND